MADALELVGVAEAAAARAASRGSRRPSEEHSEAFVWRQPLMRPAGNEQQVILLSSCSAETCPYVRSR